MSDNYNKEDLIEKLTARFGKLDARTLQIYLLREKYPDHESVYAEDQHGNPVCALVGLHDWQSEDKSCRWDQHCHSCKKYFCSGEDTRCGSCCHYIFNTCSGCAPFWGTWDTIACQTPEERGWDTEMVSWERS